MATVDVSVTRDSRLQKVGAVRRKNRWELGARRWPFRPESLRKADFDKTHGEYGTAGRPYAYPTRGPRRMSCSTGLAPHSGWFYRIPVNRPAPVFEPRATEAYAAKWRATFSIAVAASRMYSSVMPS